MTMDEGRESDYAVKLATARTLGRRSLFYLGQEILGYKKFGPSHVKWDRWIRVNSGHDGTRHSLNLILQPRETFKTTFFVITKTIQLLINNPQLSILIMTEQYGNGCDILKEIKRHLEGNEKLRYLYGDMVGASAWTTDSITIRQKTESIKEASVFVAGIGSATTGKHPDIIFCDDIAGKKDKESEVGRKQTLSAFQDSWDLLKKESGQYFLIGTRKHVTDIYYHVLNTVNPNLKEAGLPGFNILETPAHEGGNPQGKLNFPDILPQKKLDELRIVKIDSDGVDYATYMAEYELVPLDSASQIFKNLTYVDHTILQFDRIAQWTDPAMSKDKAACYSAIVTVGHISEGEYQGKFVALGASLEKRAPTQVIKDHNRIYRETAAGYPMASLQALMEANGFQGLSDFATFQSLIGDDEPVPTKGVPNRENKDARIQSLEPAISTGILMFREDWRTAPGNYKLLIEQLLNYPQADKDGPDGLEGAYRFVKSSGMSGLYTSRQYENDMEREGKADAENAG